MLHLHQLEAHSQQHHRILPAKPPTRPCRHHVVAALDAAELELDRRPRAQRAWPLREKAYAEHHHLQLGCHAVRHPATGAAKPSWWQDRHG